VEEQRGNVDEKRVYLPGGLTSLHSKLAVGVPVPPSAVDVGRSTSAEFHTGLRCACIEKLNLPFNVGGGVRCIPNQLNGLGMIL
jgi:hypothetical protein